MKQPSVPDVSQKKKLAKLAARLYIVDGLNIKDIAQIDGMPRERTLKMWMRRGYGNNGIDWDASRKAVQSKIASATAEATVEELKEQAREALELLMQRFREGRGSARFADLPSLAEFLLQLENLDEDKIRFMKTFVREAARILARHIDDEIVLSKIAIELDELVARLAKDMLNIENISLHKK